jgi:hypothetical protein
MFRRFAAKPAGLVQKCGESAEDTNRRYSDPLVGLAGRLQPDGGMPGYDDDERWFASALALVCFISARYEEGTRAFDAHIERLLEFLKSSASADSARQSWLERVELGEIRFSAGEAWRETAERLAEDKTENLRSYAKMVLGL